MREVGGKSTREQRRRSREPGRVAPVVHATRSDTELQILRLQRLAGNEATAEFLMRTPAASAPASVPSKAKPDQVTVGVDYLMATYLKGSNNEESTESSLAMFIKMTSNYARGVMARGMERAIGPDYDVAAIKAAIDQFATTTGRNLIKRLAADPHALQLWRKVQETYVPYLDGSDQQDTFVDSLEAKILPAYAAAEVKGTGKTPERLQLIADVQIRPIIEYYLGELSNGVTQAAVVWHGLPMPSKHTKTSARFEGGAAATHFAMEAAEVLFEEGSLILEVGIPELAILKFALELSGIWAADAEQEEWERKLERQRELESEARTDLFDMFNRIHSDIHKQRDVLALMCAARAVKAGLNPEGPAKGKTEKFVREEVFGKHFPKDAGGVRQRALDRLYEIARDYSARLSGGE